MAPAEARELRLSMDTRANKVSFSIPSIIAIVAAIWSFVAGPGFGFILALVAIVFGIIGVILSLSPTVRGGIISILSMAAGAIAIVVAIMKALMRAF